VHNCIFLFSLTFLLSGCFWDSPPQKNPYTAPKYAQLRYDARIVCVRENFFYYNNSDGYGLQRAERAFVEDQRKFERSYSGVAPSLNQLEEWAC
jgi:hypothetical protein